jgi:16S rRNA (uracil1498-N3)-methyltransferase
MSLPLFYEPGLTENTHGFQLSEASAHHCVQVLRKVVGDTIELTDGKGNACIANLLSVNKKQTLVATQSFQKSLVPPTRLTLCISLLKNSQRLEWLLEKVTEMGIAEIQPMLCERTEHTRFRRDRLEGILIAAMIQSKQHYLPILQDPIRFTKLMELPATAHQWIAHCAPGNQQPLTDYRASGICRILIGPEGDFSETEITRAMENKYLPVSLGNTRLRTETAGMVATALILNQKPTK